MTMMAEAQSRLFDLRGKRVYVAGHGGMVGTGLAAAYRDFLGGGGRAGDVASGRGGRSGQ